MKSNTELDILLSLDGTEYTEEDGYWYKIEASRVEPTKERPHGIKYNLTLHDNYNQRILGFDNAHAVKAKKHGYYGGTIVSYDHVHRSMQDKGVPYEFKDTQQLLRACHQLVFRPKTELICPNFNLNSLNRAGYSPHSS